MEKIPEKLNNFETLIKIMNILRGPKGCPWDQKQNINSLKKYLLEEAYELLEVMDEKNYEKHKEELGDLLLQIVFQAEIRKNEGKFNINDVIKEINEKVIRRHPHIFNNITVKDSEEVSRNWDKIKALEKNNMDRKSILDGIPKDLPVTLKAEKIQKKAAKVGFDWNNLEGAVKKMQEEIAEMLTAYKKNDISNLEEEIGDVFFSLINVARLAKIDPYTAFNGTVVKFERRFRYIEKNTNIEKSDLTEMERLWNEAKKIEKGEKNET